MFDEKWAAYASTWSQTNVARAAALANLVAEDVTYTDPNSDIVGRDAFSAHMEQFQRNVPGAYFEIIDIKGHHGTTLAQWRLCGQDGSEMMRGTSFAALTEDGKFASFAGFF